MLVVGLVQAKIPADIHLNLTVFEKDLNKFYVGQKVFAYTNNAAKKYTCEVILIGQNLSTERNVEVHCHFEEYDKQLIPGMFMNADVEVKSNNAQAVPNEAIVDYENKKWVFKKVGAKQYQIVEIQTGASENGYTEIIPLNKSEDLGNTTFAVKGAYQLLMALKNKDE